MIQNNLTSKTRTNENGSIIKDMMITIFERKINIQQEYSEKVIKILDGAKMIRAVFSTEENTKINSVKQSFIACDSLNNNQMYPGGMEHCLESKKQGQFKNQ
jgi:hypothetical protein